MEYTGKEYEDIEPHVQDVVKKIENAAGGGSAFDRLDRPEEKVEAIAQIAEKVGIPRNELWTILGNVKQIAKEDEETPKLEKFEKLQDDVEFFVKRILNNVNVDQAMSKINKLKEKAQLVTKLVEMVDVPFHKVYDIMGEIIKQSEKDS